MNVKWAKEEMNRTGKNNVKKDFVYYNKDDKGTIYYRDLNSLSKKSNGKYIDWKNIKDEYITINVHGENYKVKLNFKEYKGTHNIITMQYQNESKDMSVSHLCNRTHESFVSKRIPHNYTPKLKDSLFIKEPWLKNYVKNIEDMKFISPKSGREIDCICPVCKFEVRKKVKSLTRFGFYSCEKCSKGISIPEKFYICYFDIKKIDYKYQIKKTITGRTRYFDFYVEGVGYIEVHGSQHTNKESNWYARTHQSDISKRKWCLENDYTLLEQLCPISDFEEMVKTINNTKELPSITKEEEKQIRKLMSRISSYDIDTIEMLYGKYKSSRLVAKELDMTQTTVLRLLRAHGVDTSINDLKELRKQYEQEAIQMYLKGATVKEVAATVNRDKATIYKMLQDNNIELIKREVLNKGASKQVMCITTGEVFESATKGAETYNVNFRGISACCHGRQKSAGKHPITGEKLHWEYVD